ncbi:hypothetical protein J4Q44_G00130020 [Coregonus suidteri]|uniref:DUF4704 domain-containing protein n=1 Tax=Coregonus suidteri TaxID=861788 RepID=A0AAN8R8J3_9TELE
MTGSLRVLYDGKLASSISFTYNAKATDAQLCLESSPRENPSIFVHSPHALMLQDVKATDPLHPQCHPLYRRNTGSLPSLLSTGLHTTQRQLCGTPPCGDATLLAFLVELLKSSVAMQEQMLGGKGFLVIGYLLEKLCDHVLFNAAIWIHTPAKVQLSLYTYLSAEFIGTSTIYSTIRRVGTVLQLMHTLKYYYWAINPLESSSITPKGLDGPRPSQKEIISLRAFMLLFLKQLILKLPGGIWVIGGAACEELYYGPALRKVSVDDYDDEQPGPSTAPTPHNKPTEAITEGAWKEGSGQPGQDLQPSQQHSQNRALSHGKQRLILTLPHKPVGSCPADHQEPRWICIQAHTKGPLPALLRRRYNEDNLQKHQQTGSKKSAEGEQISVD